MSQRMLLVMSGETVRHIPLLTTSNCCSKLSNRKLRIKSLRELLNGRKFNAIMLCTVFEQQISSSARIKSDLKQLRTSSDWNETDDGRPQTRKNEMAQS